MNWQGVLIAIVSVFIGMLLMDIIRNPKRNVEEIQPPKPWPTPNPLPPGVVITSTGPQEVSTGSAVSTVRLFERQNEMEKRLNYLEKVVAKHVG